MEGQRAAVQWHASHWNPAGRVREHCQHSGLSSPTLIMTCCCAELQNSVYVVLQQLLYVLGLLSDSGYPVMLVGENGCGKTSIVAERVRNVCSGEVAEVLSLQLQANRYDAL